MSLKFLACVAIVLLTTLPKYSSVDWWRETARLNLSFAGLGRLIGKPAGLRSYQSEALVQSNAWRGLIPFKSKRAHVERLLGPAKELLVGSYVYETKEEKVEVTYSQGSCKPSLEGQWKVPADTVLSITVFPQTTVLVSSLQLDKRIYKRSQEVHPENWAWYVSSETGVMVHAIQTNGCEEVMSITYRPATKDEHLRCPKNGKTASKKP